MADSKDGASAPSPPTTPAHKPVFALVALAFSTIVVIAIPVATWIYYAHAPAVDFVSFWAAGRLTLAGDPALAYDIEVHRAVELTVTNLGGLLPFPYPPPFLLLVSPLALLPYWLAYLPWILATTALYLVTTRAFISPRYALAHPAALVNIVIGQNGLLTSGIFLSGVSLVTTRPLLGGMMLGLLVVKPQLAVLVPIALIASRNWRAIGGATLSALFLLSVAAVVFGAESYHAFFVMAQQQGVFLSTREWGWGEQASIFAFLRYFGVDRSIAFAVQGVVALVAAAVTWRAWACEHPQRSGVLAAATLLVPPYLFAYDSLILILPLAVFLRDPCRPWLPAVIWLCLLVPLFGYVGIYEGPNTIPVAAALSVWGCLRSASGHPDRGQRLTVHT